MTQDKTVASGNPRKRALFADSHNASDNGVVLVKSIACFTHDAVCNSTCTYCLLPMGVRWGQDTHPVSWESTNTTS